MKIKKVVIIGMGLIGGSLGKAILKRNLADEVIGICRRESSLERAIREKSLTKGYVNDYEKAVTEADIIFIATPVHTIKKILEDLAEAINNTKVLVSDVGSTKKEITDYAVRFKDKFSFIGGHPLAGSEKSGVEHSSADLFEKSVCILTPTRENRKEEIEKLKSFWEAVGVIISVMTSEEHDKILAFSSHLPHIIAYALTGVLWKDFPGTLLAAGFKDTTRIASSDPALWKDIFISNRDNLLEAVGKFKEVLSGVEDDIRERREEELSEKLKKYKGMRDDIV